MTGGRIKSLNIETVQRILHILDIESKVFQTVNGKFIEVCSNGEIKLSQLSLENRLLYHSDELLEDMLCYYERRKYLFCIIYFSFNLFVLCKN